MSTTTAVRRYQAAVYHDEPEDAATDSRTVGEYETREEALAAARAALGGYWNGGASVDAGDFALDRYGHWYLVFDFDQSCYVSPDGQPDAGEWGLLS